MIRSLFCRFLNYITETLFNEEESLYFSYCQYNNLFELQLKNTSLIVSNRISYNISLYRYKDSQYILVHRLQYRSRHYIIVPSKCGFVVKYLIFTFRYSIFIYSIAFHESIFSSPATDLLRSVEEPTMVRQRTN